MKETDIYESRDYRRSQKGYIAQSAFNYLIALVMQGAYLAKLLSDMGLSDSLIGIISSLQSFSALIQLFSILMMKKIRDIRRTVRLFYLLSSMMYMLVYLIPVVPLPSAGKAVLTSVMLMSAYIFQALIGGLGSKLGTSYVSPAKRGIFQSTNELVSLFAGIVFSLATGLMVDRFEAAGKLKECFLMLSFMIFILMICSFISVSAIRKIPADEAASQQKSLKEIAACTLHNRSYRAFVLMVSAYGFASGMLINYVGIYNISELGFSVGTIQIFTIIANGARMVLSRPFGRLSDRQNFANGYFFGLIFAAGAFFMMIFTLPGTRFFVIIYLLLLNIAAAGTEGNTMNMIFSYVDKDCFTQALVIMRAVTGICAFLASLIGSRIIRAMQQSEHYLFGVRIYGQNVLALCACLLVIGVILYNRLVVSRLEDLHQ